MKFEPSKQKLGAFRHKPQGAALVWKEDLLSPSDAIRRADTDGFGWRPRHAAPHHRAAHRRSIA